LGKGKILSSWILAKLLSNGNSRNFGDRKIQHLDTTQYKDAESQWEFMLFNMLTTYTVDKSITLGEGASGKVYKGQMKRLFSRKTVAVKYFDLKKSQSLVGFLAESEAIKTIKPLGSKYFTKVYQVAREGDSARIVMKLFDCDLFEYSQHYGEFESLMRPIFLQICKGVKKLHDHGIAHLDLKPENILLKGNTPVITDFGTMHKTDRVEDCLIPTSTFKGTGIYAGPEIRSGRLYNPFLLDIFSIGVMIHACLTRTFPYRAGSTIIDLSYLQQSVSAELADLVTLMLSPIPTGRPSIDEVLNHPWFTRTQQSLYFDL
jgi:serine/threonine protein kinase